MSAQQFFTADTVGQRKSKLTAIRAGPCWVYVDHPDTFEKAVRQHVERMSVLLAEGSVISLYDLQEACRADDTFREFESRYIHYVADAACAKDMAEKMLCRNVRGGLYPAYLSCQCIDEVRSIADSLWDELQWQGTLQFRDAATIGFGTKEAFRPARAVLEHFVFLGVAWHNDKWSVRK